MSEQSTQPPSAVRLRDVLLRGSEPPPARVLARQSYYPWLIVGTTCVGAFIGQLDASIVQLALPTLEREFNATLGAVSWVAIAYTLAFAAILPVFGRLAEILGRKLPYLIGYLLFAVASALCGFTSDLTLLIVLRAVQGIGGALLGANSIAILVKASGASGHARAMGLFAAAQAIGVSAGPAIGGLLLNALGWHWVFWVSVPFGLAGAIIGWFVLPQTTDVDPERRFDWKGALLLTPALISLLITLTEIQEWGPTSLALIACAVAAAILLSMFIRQERSTPAPLLDLRLFGDAAFAGGVLAVVLSYAMLYGMFFLTSFVLIRGYADAAISAGFRLAVIPIALGLVAPFSGAMCERLGPRILTSAGMAVCSAALILLYVDLTGTADSMAGVMVALAMFGAGLGMFIAPNNDATIHAAPANRAGEAGALVNLTRILGTGFGVASASAFLTWRLEVIAAAGGRTTAASAPALIQAVRESLLLLISFAIVAGITSLARGHHRRSSASRPPGQ